MGQSYAPYANRGPQQVTSIAAALTFNPPIVWIQVISAGSGGLVVKTEDGVSRTYSGLVNGQTIYGPFNELTSMTLTSMWIGDGVAPPPLVGAGASAPPAASLAPVLAIAVANQATMSGLAQTIDGVALSTAGMRVYLANQTTTTQNGLWTVQSGAWTRPADWAPGATIPLGTQINVAPGGTANFQAFGSSWYVDSASGVVDTGTIVAYPNVCKGSVALTSASPSTATVSSLWIKGTGASGATSVALTNETTAANDVKGVMVAGAGSGTLTITGPNTVTDRIDYTITNG